MDIKDKRWCVYIHYTENWTTPFYVGKGSFKRAYEKSNRNKFWRNVVNKNKEYHIKVICNLENEQDAYLCGRALIGFFGLRINGTGILTNMTLGGEGALGRKGSLHPMYGKTQSDSTKAKLSKSLKGLLAGSKNPMYGKTKEQNPFYGKKHTEEFKKNSSDRMKGVYVGSKNPFYNKAHSAESKLIMSEKRKGKIVDEITRNKISNTLKEKRALPNNSWSNLLYISCKGKPLIDLHSGVYYYSFMDAEKYYPYHRKKLKKMLNNEIPNKTNLSYA
jgi:hypothetical protein